MRRNVVCDPNFTNKIERNYSECTYHVFDTWHSSLRASLGSNPQIKPRSSGGSVMEEDPCAGSLSWLLKPGFDRSAPLSPESFM